MTTRYSQYDPRPPSPTRAIYSSQIQAVPATQKIVYVQPSPSVVYVQPQQPHIVEVESPKKERKVVKPKETYTPPQPKVVQQPQEEKSKYSCPRNCLWVLPLILAILGIILGSVIIDRHRGKEGLGEAKNVLDHLARHLRLAPIEKIRQIAATASCPADTVAASLGNYPGNDSGCLCPDGKVYSQFRCSTDQRSCSTVQAHPASTLNKWKGNSQVCQKTGQPFQLAPAGTCPASTAVCFAPHLCCAANPLAKITRPVGGLLRNLKIKHFSTEVNQKKPELIAELSEAQTHLPYAIPTVDNKFGAETGSTDIVADVTQLPFVQIAVSFARQICWNREVRDIPDNGQFYPLDINPQKGCGEYGAIPSEVIDVDQVKDLLTDNGIVLDNNRLPYYSTYNDDNNKANLVAIRRTLICTAPNCDKVCKDIHSDKIEKISLTTHSLLNHLHNVAISVVVFGCAIVLICIIYIVLRKAKLSAINEKDSLIFKIIFAIGVILAILCIVFGSYYLYQLDSENGLRAHQKELEAYIEKNCFGDANVKKAIQKYIAEIKDFDNLFHVPILALFWISIAFLIISIIAIALRWSEKPANFFEKPF